MAQNSGEDEYDDMEFLPNAQKSETMLQRIKRKAIEEPIVVTGEFIRLILI